MHCNHRCYECHIPACPDRVRQSIGPRIVPMFADPPEWSADKVYSPLTLVIHNGATYMSRRCVPANTALPDTDPFYNESWVMVYDMNAQVAQYREEVAQLSQQVTDFGGKIDNWEQLIVQWTALIQGWQNQFPELTKALAAITERVAILETEMDQALQDITDLQTTQTQHSQQIAANTQGLADLTPRVAAAETHLSALDEEQKVQDEHLNNLDASQTEQDTRIQAAHDLAVQAKNTADNNTQQITENAGKIAANAAEIAKHAEQLEALKDADTALDGKISQNTAAIAQNTANIAQAKTDIKQAAAAAQQAQDTATHADGVAQAAQKLAQQAKDAADAAAGDLSGVTDRVQALETSQSTQDGKITALETAQTQTAQDIADLKDGSTELPYIKDTGDTVTGDYDFTGGTLQVAAPTRPADAATKKYVDDALSQATDPALTARVEALETSQTQQDTEISNLKNGTTALPYVKKTGDAMTGILNMSTNKVTNIADPTANGDAVNKKYVDAIATETETNLKGYVDSKITNLENGSTALPYVKKTGDSMNGVLNMSNNKVTNVADPTANGDAVNYKTMNAMKTALESQIENLSGLLDTANQMIQDLEQRVEELEQNPPQPVDPTTKFNQIDLSNYVGSLSGSTVNTASNFKAALQYILDNNPGKHFYYGTDHAGTTWYFASDTVLSALSNDSYTCGDGVQNNGTAVKETFAMNKYAEPIGFPPPGYTNRSITRVFVSNPTTGTFYAAFEYVDAAPGPSKYYDDAADIIISSSKCKCFVNLNTSGDSGRIAYYYNDTWYYGQGTCLAV